MRLRRASLVARRAVVRIKVPAKPPARPRPARTSKLETPLPTTETVLTRVPVNGPNPKPNDRRPEHVVVRSD
jgi:hypothetical protein